MHSYGKSSPYYWRNKSCLKLDFPRWQILFLSVSRRFFFFCWFLVHSLGFWKEAKVPGQNLLQNYDKGETFNFIQQTVSSKSFIITPTKAWNYPHLLMITIDWHHLSYFVFPTFPESWEATELFHFQCFFGRRAKDNKSQTHLWMSAKHFPLHTLKTRGRGSHGRLPNSVSGCIALYPSNDANCSLAAIKW